MYKKIVERFNGWQLETFGDSKNPHDWYVKKVDCSNCLFPLSSISFNSNYSIKYCPGCGGYIKGTANPNPPIDHEGD